MWKLEFSFFLQVYIWSLQQWAVSNLFLKGVPRQSKGHGPKIFPGAPPPDPRALCAFGAKSWLTAPSAQGAWPTISTQLRHCIYVYDNETVADLEGSIKTVSDRSVAKVWWYDDHEIPTPKSQEVILKLSFYLPVPHNRKYRPKSLFWILSRYCCFVEPDWLIHSEPRFGVARELFLCTKWRKVDQRELRVKSISSPWS